MVDISDKLQKIISLIDAEEYFTINRARQFGKTTTLDQLYRILKDKYIVLSISFEGLGDIAFSSEERFCSSFTNMVSKMLKVNNVSNEIISDWESDNNSFEDLSNSITKLSRATDKEVILFIDEVDKSSNNQLFLHFIGMLRNKYLDRSKGLDYTFKSVILAGVYDVKNLKLKVRSEEEAKYNSPWNIAADFKIDMSFNPKEIASMLIEYEKDANTGMKIDAISSEIYKYTNGYPFLVSKLCKMIDEELDKNWTIKGIELALKILFDERNTLFDDLIKNIENYKVLYDLAYDITIRNNIISYNSNAHELGIMFSIFKNENGRLIIHNKIFEIILYNYLIAKKYIEEIGIKLHDYTAKGLYENEDGTLDIKRALLKYQEYMKSVYSDKDKDFIERQGRLLFLAFFKPIINGQGFYFVESHTGFDKRQDVVITFGNKKYIIELKVWRGNEYHQKGIKQLEEYLNLENADEGYLVIYNNLEKEYINDTIKLNDKEVFVVWV